MKLQNIIAQISKNVNDKKWLCLVNDCQDYAINSHLIQQNGILNNISIDGHLIEVKMVDANRWNANQPPLAFSRVGIKQALSHKVFCNSHDTNTFRPIESRDNNFKNLQSFLLFSYRALCAEINKKLVNIEAFTRMVNANTLDGKIDKENLRYIIKGNELGIEDLKILKAEIENEINSNTDKYVFYSYTYPKLDIYASAIFSATSIKYPRKDGEKDLENIYIHILPLSDETLIIVGFNSNYTSHEIQNYCESWANLSIETLEVKLTNLFISNIENWGMSPNKYSLISEKSKLQFIKLMTENVNSFGIEKNFNFNLFQS